ncbi:MAG: DUF1217 domain-containing protein [Pseudomonadota bacterium]
MSYIPAVPYSGNLGWSFLQQTRDAQQAAFDKSSIVERETAYFAENIGSVTSAEDLVSDRRLFAVALGAFGLGDDISNTFFVRKVLEEGTIDPESFANKLSDKRYADMSEAFGFDVSPPNTVLSDFADKVITSYKTREFEVAVGEQDTTLRLAMGFEREFATLVDKATTDDAVWFGILASTSLRTVFEGAFGLPEGFGAIDIDRQAEVLKERANAYFGTENPADLLNEETQERLLRRFLVAEEISASAGSSSASIALALLQGTV